MRLIFVNRFYWPETPATGQLLTDLAEAMAARGHDVFVITSSAGESTPATELRHGVHIRRVRGTRWGGSGVLRKAIDFGTFYIGALWQVLRLARRQAIVIAMTDPPLLGVGASWMAHMRAARVVHWVQDIYPEIAVALSGHGWLNALRPLRNSAWRQADACVTLGPAMADAFAEAGVAAARTAIIPNWAPAGVRTRPRSAPNRLRREWNLDGRFVVAYSGNLGRVHDLEPVLALAETLRDEPNVVFLFIGDGAQRAELEAQVARRGLRNVQFRPSQPRDQLEESLTVGDVHLVTLRAGCERHVYPSKLYGIAAAGRPVVFIGPRDSDIGRVVDQHQLGLAAERGREVPIAEFLRHLIADPHAWQQRSAAAQHFAAAHDVAAATAQWALLLETVGACGQSTPPAHQGDQG